MADIKLFRLDAAGGVQELQGTSVQLEKSLQTLIESNLEALLGVRFVASEHPTGRNHGGRIDTLGIDENGSPVIIEYKRALNENVINQGLFYLDWLFDHKGEFKLLVMDRVDLEMAQDIDWTAPRVLCIASDFTRYDIHAVQQINSNIELIRYRKFSNDLLLFELVNATTAALPPAAGRNHAAAKTAGQALEGAEQVVADLFHNLLVFLTSLGDDVQLKELKNYYAFKRLKNFACVEVLSKKLRVFVKVPPTSVTLEPGFTRDVKDVGHWGTGDLEITIATLEQLEKAKPLLLKSYEIS